MHHLGTIRINDNHFLAVVSFYPNSDITQPLRLEGRVLRYPDYTKLSFPLKIVPFSFISRDYLTCLEMADEQRCPSTNDPSIPLAESMKLWMLYFGQPEPEPARQPATLPALPPKPFWTNVYGPHQQEKDLDWVDLYGKGEIDSGELRQALAA